MAPMGLTGLDQPSTDGVDFDNFALTTTAQEIAFSGDSGSVIIIAHPNNTGLAFIGWDDSVDASNGFPLEAGSAISFDLDVGQQSIFAMANNSGDRLRFMTTN